jgi:phage-related protein
LGGKAPYAKPLKGFGGAGVLEIVDDDDGDTYRAVYTVRFAEVVYVLHAFQKKARRGIATPRQDIALLSVSSGLERIMDNGKTFSGKAHPGNPKQRECVC